MIRRGRQRLNLKDHIVRGGGGGGGGGLEKMQADVGASHSDTSATQSVLTMAVPMPIG
jgi:hypothetical protein